MATRSGRSGGGRPGGPRAGNGRVIDIPVPTTPAIVAPPAAGRAWDVRGVWAEWARYTAHQVVPTLVSAVFLAGAVLLAVFTPATDSWFPVAVCGTAGLLAARRPRRAWRIWRTLRRDGWKPYRAQVAQTEGAAWLILQRDRTRSNAQVIGTLKVQGGKRVREEMTTPAYEHVWFAGDPRRSGVVVPAGGGPLVYVSDFFNTRPPGTAGRVSTSRIQVAPRRPTLVSTFLDKVLSPATRRNMAARKADRAIRRKQAAQRRLDAQIARTREAQAKRAAWVRDHPAKAARMAQRARAADQRRKAQAATAQARARAAAKKPPKSTVVGLIRGRQQAKAMRDLGRRD